MGSPIKAYVDKYPTATLLLIFILIIGSVCLIAGFSVEFNPTDKNKDNRLTINELGMKRLTHINQWWPILLGALMGAGALGLGALKFRKPSEASSATKPAQ